MSHDKEWLDQFPTDLPLRPPFELYAIDVRAGGNISTGPDHSIVGVEIVMQELGGHGDVLNSLGPLTARQARALARALDAKADEADAQTIFG